jgi:acetyl esterase/lipase
MKKDYLARTLTKVGGALEEDVVDEDLKKKHEDKVILYIHGGGKSDLLLRSLPLFEGNNELICTSNDGLAYFFSSLDTHRYQMQRHARLLGGRVFAPSYRLAPQYPFVRALPL